MQFSALRGGIIGYFGRPQSSDKPLMQLKSTLTCPKCGHQSVETMPTNACQFFYDCKGCGERLKPRAGDVTRVRFAPKADKSLHRTRLHAGAPVGLLRRRLCVLDSIAPTGRNASSALRTISSAGSFGLLRCSMRASMRESVGRNGRTMNWT